MANPGSDGTPKRYTRGTAGKRLGVSVAQVRRYENDGRLHPEVENGVHYFTAEDVEELAGALDVATGGAVAILPRVMDHVEQLHKARLGVADDYRAQIQIFREENGTLRERVRELETKHLDVLRTMEDLATQRHRRELEKLTFETETEFKRTLLGRVSVLVPAVVNRLTGKAILPVEDGRILALEALSESVDAQQLSAMASILTPEQGAVIADLLSYARQSAAARAERDRRAAGGPAKPVAALTSTGGNGAAEATDAGDVEEKAS